jgi:glutathione synthase/RimK-type ligase-like ATP-grasp enzyme
VRVALVRSRLPERAALADDPLAAALADRGAEVSRPCWDDETVAWSELDLAVVRTTWDYAERREEFLAWAERTAEAVRVLNTPDVLRWNTHKSYLIELEERGAPVVPTAWLARGDRVEVTDIVTGRGWSGALAKPAVGVGGRGLVRIDDLDPAAAQPQVDALLQAGDVLVQPFLERVETQGELSVVVIDGEASHAVRKRPQDGEYRVQEERGARHELVPLDPDAVALAEWVVEATGQELLFARVDLLEDEVGALQVVELEATEPDLYLVHASEGTQRLADAICARLSSVRP